MRVSFSSPNPPSSLEPKLRHLPPSPQEKHEPVLYDPLGFLPQTKTQVPLKPANQSRESTQKRATAKTT